MIGVPESDIAKTLREFDDGDGLGDMEITTCLRKGEMEILVSHRPEERPKREALIEGLQRAVLRRDLLAELRDGR